jgi:hypothetical protein
MIPHDEEPMNARTRKEIADLNIMNNQTRRLDAGLGRKEQAIREARRAVDLVPIAKNAVDGPANVAALALVYAWTGERLSNSQLSRRFRLAHHTAISASIRAGIPCAATRASTRSLPQPRPPADNPIPYWTLSIWRSTFSQLNDFER